MLACPLALLAQCTAASYTSLSKLVFNASPTEGPWTSYSLSPESRIHTPVSILFANGTVSNPHSLIAQEPYRSLLPPASLHGQSASLTLDFGKNIAGIPTITFGKESDPGEIFGVAFAESKQFVSRTSDRAMDFFVDDGALFHTIKPGGAEEWTPPYRHMRGAFRYMTLFLNTTGTVAVTNVRCFNNMMPHWGDLRNYGGFFYSSDDFLNKIWYAGAYTIQLSTIPSSTGRGHDHFMERYGYDNSAPAGYGRAVLTDGARRDRTVWAGDRAISTTAQHYTLNDAYSSQTGIEWLFAQQDPMTGQMPYAAPPIDEWGSDTYHMWSIVVLHDTYFYSGGDKQWLLEPRQHVSGQNVSLWEAAKRALRYSLEKLDAGPDTEPKPGLLWVNHKLDWGRINQGGYNLAANCIFVRALEKMVALSSEIGDSVDSVYWAQTVEDVKRAINDRLWDENQGMYRDNTTSTLSPQDGNSLALWFGVVNSREKSVRVSEGLKKNWNEYGAVAPESPGMISTFISGFELIAHFGAGQPQTAIDLIRLMWGYVWNAPYSVQSSLIEGYYKDGRCYYPFQAYDPSYISHAHPWASGPSIVLSRNVAGLEFTDPTHTSWSVIPEVGVDLEFAVAGVSSASGKLLVSGWSKTSEWSFEMAVMVPLGTHGKIGVPMIWRWDQSYEIRLNGDLVASGVGNRSHVLEFPITGQWSIARPSIGLHTSGRHLLLDNIEAGNHLVLVTFKN
ncbi:alpha-L-rhamnosidase [Ceratobasidium sp. AG-Ba]|nr:alpha-L-rhamnosidase [Ceratobasidium sp. AG-Ba]